MAHLRPGSTMPSGRAHGVPREALMRVLPYFSCTRVQRLREVSLLWDEVCREHLKRVFEKLLEEASAKKMISEAKCLPACHWYPYSMGCVHYCLLVLHSTIESRFGKYSDSATIPGVILDRVREIFKYISKIPITYELPSDEIYDKLRNLYQISFSAVTSLEKISEKICKDFVTKGYRTSGLTKHTDNLELQETVNGLPRCSSLEKNVASACEIRGVCSYSNLETEPSLNIQKTTDNGPNTRVLKNEQQSCTIQVIMKNGAQIEDGNDAQKTTKTVRTIKLKRLPITNNSEVSSTQDNKIDSQASVAELDSESNKDSSKENIADYIKEIKSLSTRLKDSEGRNKETNWKYCTLLSELSSCKNEIVQLRSRSTLSSRSSAQSKSQVEADIESSSLVTNLRKQIRDYRRKLEESEGQLAETKRKNIASQRKLARIEREVSYWRIFLRKDAPKTRSTALRPPRTCVLQKTIRDYGEKLEKSQRKTRVLFKQHQMLMKKFKCLATKSRKAGSSKSVILDFSTASVRSIERSTVVYDTKKPKRKDVGEVNMLCEKPMARSRSEETHVLSQTRGEMKHLRDSDPCGNSEKRKAVPIRSESSTALKRSRSIKEDKLNETFHSLFEDSSPASSILFENDDHEISDCRQLFAEGSLENMERKNPKAWRTRRSDRIRSRTLSEGGLKQKNESSLPYHSNIKESFFPCTNLNTDRKSEPYFKSTPRILSCIRDIQIPLNSEMTFLEPPETLQLVFNDLQDCTNSGKIENKTNCAEIMKSPLENGNSNRKVTVNLQPNFQKGNLKGFKDTRLPIYTCPVEKDTKCREILQSSFKFKSKETADENSKIIFEKHALQIENSRELQVSTSNSQLMKTKNHEKMVESAETNVRFLINDNVGEKREETDDNDSSTAKAFHSLSETRKEMTVSRINVSEQQSSAIALTRDNIQPSITSPREFINTMQTFEPEGNLNVNSIQNSNYCDTVSLFECPFSQFIKESEELRKLRLNTEIEINNIMEKTYDRPEEKLEETLSPVVSMPSEVPAPSVGAPQAAGARVWSTRLRRSDCRLPTLEALPSRAIRLKRRAPVALGAASTAGQT